MHKYANYQDVDKEMLERDIDEIKETLGVVGQKDYEHLLKLQKWGRMSTFSGFFLILIISYFFNDLSIFIILLISIVAAVLIGTGNVARWANVAHPILHGAYDKVPNIPKRYTNRYEQKTPWKIKVHISKKRIR